MAARRKAGKSGGPLARRRPLAPVRGGGERFELALRAINEGVYDWDVANGSIYYSEAVYSVLHMPRGVKTPEGWRKRIHPEDLAAYDAAIVAHFKRKTRRFECDYRYRARDRTWRWARQHGIAIRDKRGRVVRMIGSTGDITELKRVELALAESRERYALATWAATEGIYEWNLATGTLFLSDRAKLFFGVKGAKLTPAAWNARVHREDFPGYQAALADYFRARTRQFEHEYRIRNTAGGYSWVVDRAAAVRDAKKRVIRLVGALADVTPRKLAEIELRRARDEATEALERQTATAEILKVIAESPTDVQPVFEAILAAELRLFEGFDGTVWIVEGEHLVAMARSGPTAGLSPGERVPISAASAPGIVILGRRVLQIDDVLANKEIPETARRGILARGRQAVLWVPLIREGSVIGALTVSRDKPYPFSEKQVALLRTFADQAVIAIENVRLFNETREALERQTATTEILKVISSSPTDVQPVFEAIVQAAARLFGRDARIRLIESGQLVLRARSEQDTAGAVPPELLVPIDRDTNSGRIVLEGKPVQVADSQAPDAPAYARARRGRLGYRAIAGAPLMRDKEVIGVINVTASQPGALSERQMSLLQTFADQAVIAIENVRLFNETKEALERQTATAEILKVISQSTTDVQPVLEAIVRSAARLFPQCNSFVFMRDGGLVRLQAMEGVTVDRRLREDLGRIYPVPFDPAVSSSARAMAERHPNFCADTEAPEVPEHICRAGRAARFRSNVVVPLVRDDEGIGTIVLTDPRPGYVLAENQLALLQTFADQAVIAIENVRLFNETREALERQTATAEILKVIASSPADVQPVFDAIAASARRLLDGGAALVARRAGDKLELAAYTSTSQTADEALLKLFPAPITGQGHMGKAILSGAPVRVSDIQNDDSYSAAFREMARVRGLRSVVSVPMLREGEPIGVISVNRPVAGEFSDHQTNLLKTFADQAVIAIENVRLFNETKEALERQTATAEILKVIASSPSDVQPVFDAIAQAARRLVGAFSVAVLRLVGDQVHLAALTSTSPAGDEALRLSFPRPVNTMGGSRIGDAIHARTPQAIADIQSDPDVREDIRTAARARGFRGSLAVPMLLGGEAVGVINVTRSEAGYFSDHQIELLKTFADQAVIAIENVRLFNETREALERQTATGEILGSMSGSMTDTKPVFDAIVRNALSLFGSQFAAVFLLRDERVEVAAYQGEAGFEKIVDAYPLPLSDQVIVGKAMLERRALQLAPISSDPEAPPRSREFARQFGYESIIAAPMIREGKVIGGIATSRRSPARFDDKQVALLQSFADQAVIAIENVRLFNETREALERQTATADILKVIASSPSNVRPVFDAIVQSAVNLCGAEIAAVFSFDGNLVHLGATYNWSEEALRYFAGVYPAPPSMELMSGRTILSKAIVKLADAAADGHYDPKSVATGHWRRMLGVPMMRGSQPLGALVVCWREPGETPQRQVDLLQTFADQAVIAIENVRLFNETREALERQTATAEILRVIASSPADVQPVFDAIVQTAKRLIGAFSATVTRLGDGMLHLVAHTATTPEGEEALNRFFPIPVEGTPMGRAIQTLRPSFVDDFETEADQPPEARELARSRGFRSVAFVPLLRGDVAIGALNVTRREPGRISDHHIGLLETFASQAVIAIENVRLFNETKEALERQTATAEILRVISQSPSDVRPVFNAIIESAMHLCDAHLGTVGLYDGMNYRHVAQRGGSPEYAKWLLSGPFAPDPVHTIGQMVAERRPVHVSDYRELTEYREGNPRAVATAELGGARTFLAVPMLRDGGVVGGITMRRTEVRPFTQRQIDLVSTFASQAVIAIENVRLFNETKEALERQTATAEILRVISRSPDDVQPVLEAVASSAARLCEARDVVVLLREGDHLRYRVHLGDIATGAAVGETKPISRDWGAGRCAAEGRQLHVHDILAQPEEFPEGSRMGMHAGYRTVLMTPLLREGVVLGVIGMRRAEVRPFDTRQIELINTFADQAVIAIENVRLFNETKEALERQTATAEILKVISSSPTDTQPVFDAIVRSALRLFNGHGVGILLAEGEVLHLGSVGGAIDRESAHKRYPMPLNRNSTSGQAILDRSFINIADSQAPDMPELLSALGREIGYRSVASAPMMREGAATGAITVMRKAVGAFSEKEVALLKTFADQAVIAIENVRLFKELQSRTEALTKSVGQLTALSEVGQAISSTLDLDTVLKTIVVRAVQLTGLNGGSIYEFDERSREFHLRAAENMPEELAEVYRRMPIRLGEGIVGSAGERREPMQAPDIQDPSYQTRYRELLIRQGYRAILAVPLLREEQIIGALTVSRNEPGEFAPEVIELLKTFATQSAMAIQNARLFREIAEKGRQLEEASRHKSNFLASMSHELRTPLNAILGFNEMILGQVYGEVPADMRDPLADIQASGKHLLRLINNVLDLAKIEAGRMELALADYSVHDTVASVHSTLRPLAADKGLEFHVSVPNDVPLAHGDGGRMAQCLINLAGNSLKFTKAGRVEIAVELKAELLVYKVADTGIGIPPDKIGSLFTEFKQTDATIASEYGGTGLGLSISRKFVEMHGGRIWVESEMGKGSTFIIEVPLRVKTS